MYINDDVCLTLLTLYLIGGLLVIPIFQNRAILYLLLKISLSSTLNQDISSRKGDTKRIIAPYGPFKAHGKHTMGFTWAVSVILSRASAVR